MTGPNVQVIEPLLVDQVNLECGHFFSSSSFDVRKRRRSDENDRRSAQNGKWTHGSRQYKTTSPTSPEINEQAEIKVYGHTNITHTRKTHTHFIDFTVLAEILEARAGVGTGSRTGFAWGRGCQSVGVLLEFSGSSLQKNKKSCLTCSLSTPLKNTAQFRGREVLKFFKLCPP